MKFKLPIDVTNQEADDSFVRFVAQTFGIIQTILDGNVEFVGNCKTSFVTVTFSAANVSQAVAHSLKRVPLGYLLVGGNVSGTVIDGNTAQSQNTDKYIYLQATVAGTRRLLIF